MHNEKDYYAINDRISNSAIGWFIVSPRYCKAQLSGEIEEISKRYFETGQQIHMYLLENERFFETYNIFDFVPPKSENQKQFCADWISSTDKKEVKALKCYKKNYACGNLRDSDIVVKGLDLAENMRSYIRYLKIADEYKETLTTAKFKWIQNLAELVKQHKLAKDLIYSQNDPLEGNNIESFNEHHINWEYPNEYNGIHVPCKSLLDRFIIDHSKRELILVDIKTTALINEFPTSSFVKFDYGRQLAFYWLALDSWLVKENRNYPSYTKKSYITAISTNPEIQDVRVYRIDDNFIEERKQYIDNVMKEISWHWSKNIWDHSRSYYEGDGIDGTIPVNNTKE